MDFMIEKLTVTDVDAVYKLGCAEKDFSADGGENVFWPKQTLVRLIESSSDVTLKVVVNKRLVGFSLVAIHPATKKAVIENLFVISEYQYLLKELYLATESAIVASGAEFIAYMYDEVDDCLNRLFFEEQDFFVGNSHLWMHKNIHFRNYLEN